MGLSNNTSLRQELDFIAGLSDKQVNAQYNVDNRIDAIELVTDYWGEDQETFDSEIYSHFCYENWN